MAYRLSVINLHAVWVCDKEQTDTICFAIILLK